MKKITLYLIIMLVSPAMSRAQYFGGFGRGDASFLLSETIVTPPQFSGGVGGGDMSLSLNSKYLSNWFITSGNWNTAENWSDNTIPGLSDNANISAAAVVDGDYTYPALTIAPDGSVTILPGKNLTVSGALTNDAGNTGLVIKSDVTGTGSLIHNSTGVYGTFERYMNDAAWTNWKDGWHFLSSPVAMQEISPNFTTEPYDLYCWHEPSNLWVNYKNGEIFPTWNDANGSTNFTIGKGYMAAYDEATTRTFSGILNVEDVPILNLTITGTQTNRSWHLLGNPFSSALTWDASQLWALNNIAGVAKIWNEEDQSYTDLTSSPASVVPATNGFMVQVAAGTGSLTIPAIKRIHDATTFYKSTDITLLKLIARNLNSGNAQESNLIFNPDATKDFDLKYDGEFLSGYGPRFYSMAGDEKLSTNSFPSLPSESNIPFVFIPNEGNNFQIEVSGLESVGTTTWLLDKKTNTDQNLSINPVYNFTASSTDNPERFLIHFFNTVGTNEATVEEQLKVWYHNHTLTIISQTDKSKLEIFDLQGMPILTGELTGKGSHALAFNYPPGLYVVKLTGNTFVKSTKIVAY